VTPGRAGYRPVDTLYLWLLTNPAEPVLIGELNAVRSLRGVSLRYDDSWLGRGFALSEDLPLIAQEFLPREKDTAAGAVDDARPDRWGERVIRFLDKPARLSLLEYLYFAGDDRFGALGVSTARKSYQPRGSGPLPSLADVETMQRLVEMVLAGEPIPEPERRLISPGATMGVPARAARCLHRTARRGQTARGTLIVHRAGVLCNGDGIPAIDSSAPTR